MLLFGLYGCTAVGQPRKRAAPTHGVRTADRRPGESFVTSLQPRNHPTPNPLGSPSPHQLRRTITVLSQMPFSLFAASGTCGPWRQGRLAPALYTVMAVPAPWSENHSAAYPWESSESTPFLMCDTRGTVCAPLAAVEDCKMNSPTAREIVGNRSTQGNGSFGTRMDTQTGRRVHVHPLGPHLLQQDVLHLWQRLRWQQYRQTRGRRLMSWFTCDWNCTWWPYSAVLHEAHTKPTRRSHTKPM